MEKERKISLICKINGEFVFEMEEHCLMWYQTRSCIIYKSTDWIWEWICLWLERWYTFSREDYCFVWIIRTHNVHKHLLFHLAAKFLFISWFIAMFFVIITFSLPPRPPNPLLPLSMNLYEKAPKEGLGLVNGGQLHQLLHPNEAALSFTKPQLITLQVISKQDCLQLLISAARPPPFTHNQQDGDTWKERRSETMLL